MIKSDIDHLFTEEKDDLLKLKIMHYLDNIVILADGIKAEVLEIEHFGHIFEDNDIEVLNNYVGKLYNLRAYLAEIKTDLVNKR